MEYSKGYPCLYCLAGEFAVAVPTGWCEVVKNGTTWHLANRKSGAITYFPKKPAYRHVIVCDPGAFRTKADLYALDSKFVEFLRMRGLGRLHLVNGGGQEWFYLDPAVSYLALRQEFLAARGIRVLAVLETDPYPIRDLAPSEVAELATEDAEAMPNPFQDLKADFFETFGAPRRNQSELWDAFEAICHRGDPYKGIVQWVTGAGKTIGMLSLIVLAAAKAKRDGKVFRALLIAPRNDIFDTIISHIHKLYRWGIEVFQGQHARLSWLQVQPNKPLLILATHASLVDAGAWDILPPMDHVHYDEVHRITGDEFYGILTRKLQEWGTPFLTGTSATPRTCSVSQNTKLGDLFGSPLPILHRCDVEEAVQEGWIAQPRFGVNIIPSTLLYHTAAELFVKAIQDAIQQKRAAGKWSGGKVIAYLPMRHDVIVAIEAALKIPGWKIYTAVDSAYGIATHHSEFVTDPADGTPRILFACDRYREGSDIRGIEMTVVRMGRTIAGNILLQIAGRALRADHTGKEGWCIIVRTADEYETEDDVLNSVVLNIMDFVGDFSGSAAAIRRAVETFMSTFTIRGKVFNVEETTRRIQAMFLRQTFEAKEPKEKYEIVRGMNRDLGLISKATYEDCTEHPKRIENPRVYFQESWVSWYHFLGVDTSAFPPTKAAWVQTCKERGLTTWDAYKNMVAPDLPANPSEAYEDYTNWDHEFGIVEEVQW